MQKSCEIMKEHPKTHQRQISIHHSRQKGISRLLEKVWGQQADGSLRGEPDQPSLEPKEDTPTRHLNPEEMVRGVDDWERLREDKICNGALEAKTFPKLSLPCELQALKLFFL